MCFSAEASFAAGAVLSIAGIAAIKKAQTRSEIAFASIPLIFGVQQVTEGFVWLSLLNTAFASWNQPATYIFLAFAQVVWPSWVPFSILLLEKENGRRNALYIMLGIGLIVSFYLALRLLKQDIHSEIIGHHIYYNIGFSTNVIRSLGVMYFISTIIPPFISGIKKMWSLGFSILLSYIVTKLFFENYVISVWCFFAAVISVVVYAIVRDLQVSGIEKGNIQPAIKT